MIKKLTLAALMLAVILLGTACHELDVVGNGAVDALGDVLTALNAPADIDPLTGGWTLDAPDGSARFIWSQDIGDGAEYDVGLELDAQPFLHAGLDASKLPPDMLRGDRLVLGAALAGDAPSGAASATPIASFARLVRLHPGLIGYHHEMDHFNVTIGSGNLFEWAKDMAKNDKDIVFVLDPKPFADADVDLTAIAGWTLAKVPTMDAQGNPVEVEKLLKPFDLIQGAD